MRSVRGMALGLGLIVVGLAARAAMAESYIVKDGVPRAQIVIAENPTRTQKLAAEELRDILRKISGAELLITNRLADNVPVTVYVGRSAYTDRLDVHGESVPGDGFRMVSGDTWLALVGDDSDYIPREPYAHKRSDRDRVQKDWDAMTGNRWACPGLSAFKGYNEELGLWFQDRRGSLNAVYEFLRSLGARWYFPDEFGECLPVLEDIPLPVVDRTVRPDFSERVFGFSRYYFGNDLMSRGRALWYLRLGLRSETVIATHGIDYVIHHDTPRTTHPEWYMLVDGKRDTVSRGGKPCLSAEGLAQSNVEFVRAFFDVYDAKMANVMPTDGYVTLCQCPLCEGKSSPERGYRGLLSDYVWGYANKVAKEVYKTHPHKLVSCGSYTAFQQPPQNVDQLSPNLVVRIKRNRMRGYDPQTRQDALALREAWMEKLSGEKPIRMGDNYSAPGNEGLPIYFPHLIAQDMQSLKDICESEYIEVNASSDYDSQPPVKLAVNHLNIYATARLWWDAEADVDALLDDYYAKFYGPAAEPMQAFIEYSETNWWKMTKEEAPINRSLELLAAAVGAAGEGTIYARRVALVEEYLKPLKQLAEKVAIGRQDMPSARVYQRRGRAITIDGKLDDPFWESTASYRLREIETGAKPLLVTSFRVGWKDDALYFGISCEEPDTQNLKIGTTEHDGMDMWNGDVIEILLETQNHAYYQIAVNPAGVIFDADRARGIRSLWESGAEVAVDVGEESWTIEIRFPIADEMQEENLPDQLVSGRTPTTGQPWYFNIGRKRVRDSGVELSMFSPTGKRGFHVQERFGRLYLE